MESHQNYIMDKTPVRGIRVPKFHEILKQTPLQIRLKVSNQMAFISLLTELGFREDKMWTDDENELLSKLCEAANQHTEHQLETIKEWEKDGRPDGRV